MKFEFGFERLENAMDMRLPNRTLQHEPERHGFNLSRWAIEHTNFTRFLLVLILSAGIFAYTN